MKFSGARFADVAVKRVFFKNQKVKICLQQNKYAYAAKISTQFLKIELLTQFNIDRPMDMDCKSFPKSKAMELLLVQEVKRNKM